MDNTKSLPTAANKGCIESPNQGNSGESKGGQRVHYPPPSTSRSKKVTLVPPSKFRCKVLWPFKKFAPPLAKSWIRHCKARLLHFNLLSWINVINQRKWCLRQPAWRWRGGRNSNSGINKDNFEQTKGRRGRQGFALPLQKCEFFKREKSKKNARET